jgi:predicted ribosomally synthesized peptide with nif11-like leader
MSTKEMVRFCTEYLPQHPELKQTIDARGDVKRLAKVVAAVAAEAGYDFSQDEVQNVVTAKPAIELSEDELEAVAGGRKAGKEQQEYLIVKMSDLLVSG